VTIYEKTPACAIGDVGAGIGIQPIGLTVLRRLGLLDAICEHGQQIDRLVGLNTNGRTVLDVEYSDLWLDQGSQLFGLGLHRGVLFHELHDAVKSQEGIELIYNAAVEDVDTRAGTITTAQGDQAFDMVVVADGRNSVRSTIDLHGEASAYEKPYTFGALWAILPDEGRVFSDQKELTQVYSSGSANKMLGFLPSGKLHGATEGDLPVCSLFYSLPVADYGAWRERGLAAWKEEVTRLEPRCAAMVSHLKTEDDLILAEYSDTWMSSFTRCSLILLIPPPPPTTTTTTTTHAQTGVPSSGDSSSC
jgi:2-polyprenyl-6-methoxyphenol hydroxylase-like FAD-dependent oxidoreductase